MNRVKNTLLQQSQPIICGVLLDLTFFLRLESGVETKLSEYVHIINSYVRLLRQIHTQSHIFIELYASTTTRLQEEATVPFIKSLNTAITTILNQSQCANSPNLAGALSTALCSLGPRG